MQTNPILYCSCAFGTAIPDATKRAVSEALARSGRQVATVSDLCGLAAKRDPLLREIAGAERATVIACHRRVVLWLFAWAGASLALDRVRFLNLRADAPEALLEALRPLAEDAGAGERAPKRCVPDAAQAEEGGWRPWFPVIDYDRCSNCRQCLEFCLFGVYGTDADGRVTVLRPDQCKNNCPSCARLCPRVAIMFPKIDEESPVNGSLEDPVAAAGKVRLSRDQLFGTVTLDQLRARQQGTRLLRKDLYREP